MGRLSWTKRGRDAGWFRDGRLGSSRGNHLCADGQYYEHLNRDRYTFKDDSGSISVNIPPHVFGALEVTPASKVRITGEIRGKRHPERPDAHVGVRYLEVLE